VRRGDGQRALGHSSASVTLDTYSHLWPDANDRLARPQRAWSTRLSDLLRTHCGRRAKNSLRLGLEWVDRELDHPHGARTRAPVPLTDENPQLIERGPGEMYPPYGCASRLSYGGGRLSAGPAIVVLHNDGHGASPSDVGSFATRTSMLPVAELK